MNSNDQGIEFGVGWMHTKAPVLVKKCRLNDVFLSLLTVEFHLLDSRKKAVGNDQRQKKEARDPVREQPRFISLYFCCQYVGHGEGLISIKLNTSFFCL